MIKKLIFAALMLLANSAAISAQSVTAHKDKEEAKKAAGQGIIFKMPDMISVDWKKQKFNGILFLEKKDPTGMFICYPDAEESIEALKNRVKKNIVPMFIHDDKEVSKYQWKVSDLPPHPGDKVGGSQMHLYEADKRTVQILIYERETNSGLDLIYGYFAMKNSEKENDLKGIWANEKGEGIKKFDKLWKSFRN